MENISLGEIIKRGREKKGLSQRKLAKILGISNTAVLYWEKNINAPSFEMLKKISELLEIGEDLFPKTAPKPASPEIENFANQVFNLLSKKIDKYLENKLSSSSLIK